MATLAPTELDRAVVLSSAVSKISDIWELSNARLAAVLGLSPATASRLRKGQTTLDPASKSYEAGQFLLRLFRSLDALLGSDDAAARRWLAADNVDLGDKPLDHIVTMRGLIETCDYVDFYRGRV